MKGLIIASPQSRISSYFQTTGPDERNDGAIREGNRNSALRRAGAQSGTPFRAPTKGAVGLQASNAATGNQSGGSRWRLLELR